MSARWEARGAEVLWVAPQMQSWEKERIYGRYVCASNSVAETLAYNLNAQADEKKRLEDEVDTFRERAALAERYYVMTQMPDTWHRWADCDRREWIRAFEDTLPPDPPVKMVTVELPERSCIRTSCHKPHVSSSGTAFCPGISE